MISEQHPFYSYFSKIYDQRWPLLFEALRTPEKQVARQSLFSQATPSRWSQFKVQPELPGCYWLENESIQPQRDEQGLLDVYVMDPASVIVARALNVQAGDTVLDMCAAPGGKSLILIESLQQSGEIFCNDLSPERRERLKKVIQQYVPRDVRDRVWVTGQDGVQFGLKKPETYDRILLDAPCSGERHILENEKAQKDWSPRRTEHLASRQYSLLAAAYLALKPGGIMVYSTCSISPAENDDVIKKLLKKKKSKVEVLPTSPILGGELTDFGQQHLPDVCGFGPLYFSIIKKIS